MCLLCEWLVVAYTKCEIKIRLFEAVLLCQPLFLFALSFPSAILTEFERTIAYMNTMDMRTLAANLYMLRK